MTVTRGTSNGNERGSTRDRAARKTWLLQMYRADVDVCDGRYLAYIQTDKDGVLTVPLGQGEPACRCYRCGLLLIAETLTVDRIIPRCQGGTYRRNNIRPACSTCNSTTGGAIRRTTTRKVA